MKFRNQDCPDLRKPFAFLTNKNPLKLARSASLVARKLARESTGEDPIERSVVCNNPRKTCLQNLSDLTFIHLHKTQFI